MQEAINVNNTDMYNYGRFVRLAVPVYEYIETVKRGLHETKHSEARY